MVALYLAGDVVAADEGRAEENESVWRPWNMIF